MTTTLAMWSWFRFWHYSQPWQNTIYVLLLSEVKFCETSLIRVSTFRAILVPQIDTGDDCSNILTLCMFPDSQNLVELRWVMISLCRRLQKLACWGAFRKGYNLQMNHSWVCKTWLENESKSQFLGLNAYSWVENSLLTYLTWMKKKEHSSLRSHRDQYRNSVLVFPVANSEKVPRLTFRYTNMLHWMECGDKHMKRCDRK